MNIAALLAIIQTLEVDIKFYSLSSSCSTEEFAHSKLIYT